MKVSSSVRKIVKERAGNRCEYCLLHEDFSFLTYHIDHIIAQKHGGTNEEDNLAYACPQCNSQKGTDLVTILEEKKIVALFNPREDNWAEHFKTKEGKIIALTEKGEATVKLLQLNAPERLESRNLLYHIGLYP
ncbi:MAG: HNH endonuclease signature motif containing protein [Bacteroidia bacterium]